MKLVFDGEMYFTLSIYEKVGRSVTRFFENDNKLGLRFIDFGEQALDRIGVMGNSLRKGLDTRALGGISFFSIDFNIYISKI
jgi:hypothetical protein